MNLMGLKRASTRKVLRLGQAHNMCPLKLLARVQLSSCSNIFSNQ